MSFIADSALDAALAEVASADTLHICSAAPTSYANVASVTLGNKASPSFGAAGDASPDGRKRTVAAISTGGSCTGTGTATHYALVDAANSKLLAWGTLSSSQSVTSGNPFTLAAFDIRMPDAA